MTVGTMIEAGELTEPSQVENALMGSICRCSGYTRIVQAIESVLDRRVDR
jgi:aerobic-type carbon monoxide dehydrogenase small subunit (CoxS/CutS family)